MNSYIHVFNSNRPHTSHNTSRLIFFRNRTILEHKYVISDFTDISSRHIPIKVCFCKHASHINDIGKR